MRRAVSVVLAGLLAIVVGATIAKAAHPPEKHVVHGAVSPALQAFVNDAQVRHELARKRFTVDLRGSDADFAFSTDPAPSALTAFSTPLVATASKADASRLTELGVAHKDSSDVWSIDTTQLMHAVAAHQVALQTGGPTSPAGAYFAALLGDVVNNMKPPTGTPDTLVNAVSPVFVAPPPGAPVVTIGFEADAHPPGAVVMYPNPDVVANANLVAHTPAGAAFTRLLATDPVLQKRAAALGYRNATNTGPVRVNELPLPAPPVFTQLERLLGIAVQTRGAAS